MNSLVYDNQLVCSKEESTNEAIYTPNSIVVQENHQEDRKQKEAERLAEAIDKLLTWQSERLAFRENQRIERMKRRHKT